MVRGAVRRADVTTVSGGDPAARARLTILGYGLIGASVARALAQRRPDAWRVSAWSRDLGAARADLAAGVLASVAPDPESAIADADLVLLAASPVANLGLIPKVGPIVARAGALLTDVTSVQRPSVRSAAAVSGLRHVGGHPMSGRERRGAAAAQADLFVGRPWVILPGPSATDEDVAFVERLAVDCGASPIRLDAATHDDAVALISHLPLVAAAALVQAATTSAGWAVARGLAAQGWRDSTRLARGDPELGGGILALNASAVAEALRAYRAALDAWQARLDAAAAMAGDPRVTAVALADELDRIRRSDDADIGPHG